MKKKTWIPDLKSALFLVIVITVCTLFLSATNSLYQGVIAERQKVLRMEILTDFGISFTEDTFSVKFNETVEVVTDRRSTYFLYKGTPKQAGIITTGAGLWGTIDLLLIIDENSGVIKKLKVLHHTETPGLGGRIEEEWFTSQFSDLDYSKGIKIVQKRTGAAGEVDGISGATVTSNSVEAIINNGLERYREKTGR
jgi:Na+-transporting NADH:ubiquinone oxidoreductase subunit C